MGNEYIRLFAAGESTLPLVPGISALAARNTLLLKTLCHAGYQLIGLPTGSEYAYDSSQAGSLLKPQ
jgi:hypothetical protein